MKKRLFGRSKKDKALDGGSVTSTASALNKPVPTPAVGFVAESQYQQRAGKGPCGQASSAGAGTAPAAAPRRVEAIRDEFERLEDVQRALRLAGLVCTAGGALDLKSGAGALG